MKLTDCREDTETESLRKGMEMISLTTSNHLPVENALCGSNLFSDVQLNFSSHDHSEIVTEIQGQL